MRTVAGIPLTGLVSLSLLLGSTTLVFGKPVSRQIVLREQLNQQYGGELLVYPFTAKQKKCVPESVLVSELEKPLPAQLAEIEYWSDKKKYVKAARLYILVDELKPLATRTFTLTWDRKKAPRTASDLEVKSKGGRVEITTSRTGLRLPLGERTFAEPVAALDAPGPLQAMRLGSAAWAGGSALAGEVKVTKWSAQLTDAGPAFARVVLLYTLADGNVLTLTATVAAGDTGARWDMAVQKDLPDMAVEFRLPPVPGVKQAVLPKGYGQWARDRKLPVTPSSEPFCFLSPDTSLANIWADCPQTIRMAAADGPECVIRSRDPGAWADPVAPFTYGGCKAWNLEMIPKMWEVWKRKRIAVSYATDGTITLRAPLTGGRRKWTVSAGMPGIGDRLDRVKDMVLDWPAPRGKEHPLLFVSRQEVLEDLVRAKTDPVVARQLRSLPHYTGPALTAAATPAEKRAKQHQERAVGNLRSQLAKMGNFDVMRYAIRTAAHYDALIDSGLLSPKDRALFRAQMACLGYVMADPGTWSMERGYLSGNPNMSCSYTLSLGVISCLLKGHPMAKQWADYATSWMDMWLTREVGPNGMWMPEGSHYGYVSLVPMLSYAIAAQRAGYHDFLTDPRLKKVILYFAKYQTPRDPQRRNRRVTPAFGRGTSGDSLGVFGLAARMYAQSDPDLSRLMQWVWIENGHPLNVGDSRLGGYEGYYLDRGLPAAQPKWGSELFPGLGTLMRAGFATPTESFVNVLACVQSPRNLDIWVPGIGGITQWFGRGQPLSTCFTFRTGYAERHELLREGVLLARNWGAAGDPKGPFGYYTETRFGTFAALPQADYVRSRFVINGPDDRDWFPKALPAYPRLKPAGEGKLDWTRQVLFLKDPNPAGPAYLIIRDTTSGGQPTAWQFWSLSEKIGTPDQIRDRAAFLADKPGKKMLPARKLPPGSRYTAVGQRGMDLEYFVASPAGTPRHTLRYGGARVRVPEYQDLLHLQQPGDGAYYLALFPRPQAEAVPTFTNLADGKIIKVAGPFGTDYGLLSEVETSAAAEDLSFRATAAAVQVRASGTMLSLGAPGEVRTKAHGLVAPSAAALQISNGALRLTLPSDNSGGKFTILAPGDWHLKERAPGTKLISADGRHTLTLPRGTTRAILVKGK